MLNPQLNRQGRLVHLLSTEGLSRALLTALLDAADRHVGPHAGMQAEPAATLAHWQVAMWREDRAQAFGQPVHTDDAAAEGDGAAELPHDDSPARLAHAAALLGAQVVMWPGNMPPSDTPPSSTSAMSPDLLIMRHTGSGAAHWVARRTLGPRHIINAGDGAHEDPVAGLTMVAALRRALPDLTALTITLVGNLNASAAGRSCLHILTTLGVPEVRLATPPTLAPEVSGALGVQSYVDVDAALAGADVVVVLPRAATHGDPSRQLSANEYRAQYGLSGARLAAACAGAVVLLAPGLDHGVEVAGDLAPATPLSLSPWGDAVSLAILQTLIEGEA
jgi:aspartate carbamoyltransferase catalytic subunit